MRFAQARAIVSLGGFSSILLEGRMDILPAHPETAFTTGNTLTVALIVRGIERALDLGGRELRESNVLIVGASGDVGSGCARYLAPQGARGCFSARETRIACNALLPNFRVCETPVEADTDLYESGSEGRCCHLRGERDPPDRDAAGASAGRDRLRCGLSEEFPSCFRAAGRRCVLRRARSGIDRNSTRSRLAGRYLSLFDSQRRSCVSAGGHCVGAGEALRAILPGQRLRSRPSASTRSGGSLESHGIGLPPLFNSDGLVTVPRIAQELHQ